MKVRLIKKKTLEEFARINSQSKSSLTAWLRNIRFADWEEPGDINRTYKSADLLGRGSNRVIFDIGGNNYRMICKYWFGYTRVHLYVKWIGTHAEYDDLYSKNFQYTVEDF